MSTSPTEWLCRLLLWVGLLLFPSGIAMAWDQLQVAGKDQLCEKDADCTAVQTDCSGCSHFTPINKIHKQKYVEQHQALCAHYDDILCGAVWEPSVACCHTRCTLSALDPQRKFEIGKPMPFSSPYIAWFVAMQFWAERYSLTPCDFTDLGLESFVEDAGRPWLWRVKGPKHLTPPLEVEIDLETGHVKEIEQQ